MALHGNKPIRLAYGNTRTQHMSVGNNGRHVAGNNAHSSNTNINAEKKRRLRIARLRLLRQQRLMKLRSMTTTEATTTTTTLPPTTTTPTTPQPETMTTTSWYDSQLEEMGQSSTPGGFTDSFLDYNYEYKIDDY